MNSFGYSAGKVLLVGAGPGDPDLLTLKALKAIQSADLILFDQLVSDGIRALFPASVPAFYVGKVKGKHSIAQADLNKLLVKKARQGKMICRLKGGDPFVFGTGGEELLELRQAGVTAEVIPGVTSASGCTAYAGIPLTHRGLAQGCTLVTAHGEKECNLNWPALAQLNHTLVFYMGVSRAHWIEQRLLQAGINPRTPVAVIENGCRANQKLVVGEIQALHQIILKNDIKSPAIIVVGEVVSLAQQLSSEQFMQQLNIDVTRLSA